MRGLGIPYYFSTATCLCLCLKNFENAKVVIRNRKPKKDRQYNGQKKMTKGQTMICKTIHRKLKFEQQKPH